MGLVPEDRQEAGSKEASCWQQSYDDDDTAQLLWYPLEIRSFPC